MGIIKSKPEIYNILISGKILADLKTLLQSSIKEGISTLDLDTIARRYLIELRKKGVWADFSFDGYIVNGRKYSHAICICVNDEVVHGIPRAEKILKDKDLVSVDLGIKYNGYHTDSAFTIIVGGTSVALVASTNKALYSGISKAVAGNRISDISFAIQQSVEMDNFYVVRQFAGHGVGTKLHEKPQVLNYGKPGRGLLLVPGMVLAIEPIITESKCGLVQDKDGWTYRTDNGGLSAHFEETIIITDKEPIIATKSA